MSLTPLICGAQPPNARVLTEPAARRRLGNMNTNAREPEIVGMLIPLFKPRLRQIVCEATSVDDMIEKLAEAMAGYVVAEMPLDRKRRYRKRFYALTGA